MSRQWPDDERIAQILENFNFRRVHAYVWANDWRTIHDDGTLRIPTIETLRNTAHCLLIALREDEECTLVEHAGLVATRSYDTVELRFSIETVMVVDGVPYTE